MQNELLRDGDATGLRSEVVYGHRTDMYITVEGAPSY